MTDRLMGSAEFVDGVCWVRLSRRADPSRKRIEIDQPGITWEEAKLLAHQMSDEMIRRKLRFPSRQKTSGPSENVQDYTTRWHEDRVARKVVETARHDRGRLTEHVLPIIGDWPIATVPKEKIEEVVLSLDAKVAADDMSWKTAANVWGTVSKLFADARGSKNRALRVRDDDPTDGVSPPERGEEKAKAFLYPSEFLQLVDSEAIWSATGHRIHAARHAQRWMRSFTLAIYLYSRAGELRAIRWSDVDFEHWTIHIHRAVKRDTGGKLEKKTKTHVVRRFEAELELRPLLLAMRDEAIAKHGKDAWRAQRMVDLPHEADLSARLTQYLQWAGITREELFADDATRCSITFKDLRATGLTWRAMRGDNPLRIQRSAGHKDLATTQIYIRVAEDAGRGAGPPFPALPARVVGAVPAQACPTIVPQNRKTTAKQAFHGVPSGIRIRRGSIFIEKSGGSGTDCPTESAESGLKAPRYRARKELWKALAVAVSERRAPEAMALAARLAGGAETEPAEIFAIDVDEEARRA